MPSDTATRTAPRLFFGCSLLFAIPVILWAALSVWLGLSQDDFPHDAAREAAVDRTRRIFGALQANDLEAASRLAGVTDASRSSLSSDGMFMSHLESLAQRLQRGEIELGRVHCMSAAVPTVEPRRGPDGMRDGFVAASCNISWSLQTPDAGTMAGIWSFALRDHGPFDDPDRYVGFKGRVAGWGITDRGGNQS